jgi:hypothetical protein
MTKRAYVNPSLIVIGRVTALTGMYKNLDYLDNSNGGSAYKTNNMS